MWQTVLSRRDGQIARISLNRPEKHNAQNMLMIQELDEALTQADADPEVRVIILSGEGKSFSAGHDLSASVADPEIMAQRATAEGRTDLEYRMYYQKCMNIRNLNKPTIAQVHGHCIAAGLMVACMCDLIVASEDASFANPVLRMGAAGVEVLVELWEIGARRTKELLFTGDPITARQALEWGFVNRVVPRDQLEAETQALAEKIAKTPPVTLRLTKKSINRALDTMGQGASWEQHFTFHMLAHDTEEARLIMEERRRIGDVKRWVQKRDQGAQSDGN